MQMRHGSEVEGGEEPPRPSGASERQTSAATLSPAVRRPYAARGRRSGATIRAPCGSGQKFKKVPRRRPRRGRGERRRTTRARRGNGRRGE